MCRGLASNYRIPVRAKPAKMRLQLRTPPPPPMAASMVALLRELEGLKTEFGGNAARRKLALLRRLRRGRLARATDVLALHEQLCFMRAYPDDVAILQCVEQLLQGFNRRSDLRRFAEDLADTGIAGTSTHYAFFAPTARWLARR